MHEGTDGPNVAFRGEVCATNLDDDYKFFWGTHLGEVKRPRQLPNHGESEAHRPIF